MQRECRHVDEYSIGGYVGVYSVWVCRCVFFEHVIVCWICHHYYDGVCSPHILPLVHYSGTECCARLMFGRNFNSSFLKLLW